MSGKLLIVMVLVLLVGTFSPQPANSAPIGHDAFWRTWARTDLPVQNLMTNRTWMWGPEANLDAVLESYVDSPGGMRLVQYFDKTRMEINDVTADQTSLWYVTNGLLARELITGRMQLGDTLFEQFHPAQVHIAGDPDPNAPTYATFAPLMHFDPIPEGWTITQTVDRDGRVGDDPDLARHGVTAAHYVPLTNHTVASVFWDFMNSTGLVHHHGQFVQDRLFENPFYATGYPLTEAYWTRVNVGGTPKQVLVQVFERRVLTYTPDNPPGWRVEAGNVGRHYFAWRHVEVGMGICSTLDVPSYVAPAWLYPEGAIGNALEDMGRTSSPRKPWASYLYQRAEYIHSAYHLLTAEVGCFNAQTEFFDEWIRNHVRVLTYGPPEALADLRTHMEAQIWIAASQPDSLLGAKMRQIEAGEDPLRPISGPWAYWYYMIGHYPQLRNMHSFAERAFVRGWEETVSDYQMAVAGGVDVDFGLFLAESEFMRVWIIR